MLAPANRLLGGGEVREFPPLDEAGLQQHVVLEGREKVATGAEVLGDGAEGAEELLRVLGRFAVLELGKYDEEGTRQFGANGGPMTTATRRLLEQSLVSVTQST